MDGEFPSTICRTHHLFPIEWSWHLCGKLFDHIPKVLFLVSLFYPIGLHFIFMPVPHCFNCCSFVMCFEIRTSEISKFVLLFQNWFGYFGVHINFRMNFSFLCENAIEIVTGVALNLQVALGSTDILTILSFPIYEHGMAFHLLCLSFISAVFCSWQCTSFLALLTSLFPSILFFSCCWKWNYFLNFLFLDFSLLVYRNTIHFCILIFYPATLVNLLLSFNSCVCV